MKRLLILAVTLGACTTALASMSSAQTIACASEVPPARTGHWYYRIIDGRKCWYQGKAMIPKSSLHWSSETVAEGEAQPPEKQAATPATDGRNVSAPQPSAEPATSAAWPIPVADDISFESRWLGLRSGN